MDGKDAAIMLVLLAAFATAGWVIYLVGRYDQAAAEAESAGGIAHPAAG